MISAPDNFRQPWSLLEELYRPYVAKLIAERPALGPDHFGQTLQFAMGRLEEGRRLGEYFRRLRYPPLRILDLGAGDGGTSLGAANWNSHEVVALDLDPHLGLKALAHATGLPVLPVAGNGALLPFARCSFDIVLCLDMLEHVPRACELGAEIMRVLKPGGYCMITTPARLKYLLRPDPHFGIRGLLVLPDGMQRRLVLRRARRRLKLHDSVYDVHHTYWSLKGVTSLFPGRKSIEVLWNRTYDPRDWRQRFWYVFRNLLWDRIIIRKEVPESRIAR